MARFFDGRARIGGISVFGIVRDQHVVPGAADQPLPDVYGHDQLRLYLLHKIPDDAFKRLHWKDAHPVAAFWASVLVSYVLAVVSWNLLEKPFLNLERFFETKANTEWESNVAGAEAGNSEAS